MPTYTLKDAETMLGIPRSVATRLVTEGIITPTRGPRRQLLFSFQDMVLLRTANSLHDARIPTRLIVRALARVKASRGAGQPLTGVRIRAMGNEVATKDEGRGWQAVSGQMLMDFEPGEPGAAVVESLHDARAPAAEAQDWFLVGAELETEKPIEAEAAYRRALEAEPTFLDPYLNLGCTLCDAGRFGDAVELYRIGVTYLPNEPLLHFNLGVALEDMSRTGEALSSYERCITLAPDFADAHFNAARIHETLGNGMRAIRHFNAYRRLRT
ncbi:tetratricopeptide repeat protein [Cupriavidus basilensis]|uniref:tetratricopeptide repeat protein n=1 Tax=Cupriavidus basilensis TaxID=68895 RepID=UPI0020A62605|nr:tetratricopeptide repeat protein [Cupriavidus basilensis]MCP3024708.1 tetratricopeptide repeat protein [Cupriavidus basilensis]